MLDRPKISDAYLAQQRVLHENPDYGVASIHYAPIVKQLVERLRIKSISDYGAGKCNLRRRLNELGVQGFDYFPYDPVFPEYGPPRPAQLVCCIDVLEHIEEPYLEAVLLDLKEITTGIGLFTVSTRPAHKALPDGRNAHLILKPTSWWLPKFCQHFEIGHLDRTHEGFWVIAEPQKPA